MPTLKTEIGYRNIDSCLVIRNLILSMNNTDLTTKYRWDPIIPTRVRTPPGEIRTIVLFAQYNRNNATSSGQLQHRGFMRGYGHAISVAFRIDLFPTNIGQEHLPQQLNRYHLCNII